MSIQTFAQRLESVMSQRNMTPTELEKLSGVSRQSITHIVNSNLSKSKLSIQLANALNVSHDWLAYGIEDNSFVFINELLVFTDIYLLSSFILNNTTPQVVQKSITHHPHLQKNAFVFNPINTNIFYYCSKDLKIKSSKYLLLDVQNNSFQEVNTIQDGVFSFPIIEIKTVIVKV